MPKIAGDPLTKVTLNLFTADVEWYKERFGQGWSEQLRHTIRECISECQQHEREICQTR